MAGMTYAVIGMGRYGREIAELVRKTGAQIIIADSDMENADINQDQFTYAVTVDTKNADAVSEIGLNNADIVVIDLAQSLEESIICTMVAKEQGVSKVIATAKNSRYKDILTVLGADEVVIPEEEAAMRMARTLISEDFMEYIDIGGEMCVIKIHPLPVWLGKTIANLNLRNNHNANVVAMEEGGKFVSRFDINKKLEKKDTMLLAISKKDVMDFI